MILKCQRVLRTSPGLDKDMWFKFIFLSISFFLYLLPLFILSYLSYLFSFLSSLFIFPFFSSFICSQSSLFFYYLFQAQIPNPLDMDKKVDQNLKLDEILDICADFEKQIQAEQEELRLIAQQKLEEETVIVETQQTQNEINSGIQFGSISFFPSTPPLPAKRGVSPLKSPTNGINSHQWSPLNTMSPNR